MYLLEYPFMYTLSLSTYPFWRLFTMIMMIVMEMRTATMTTITTPTSAPTTGLSPPTVVVVVLALVPTVMPGAVEAKENKLCVHVHITKYCY